MQSINTVTRADNRVFIFLIFLMVLTLQPVRQLSAKCCKSQSPAYRNPDFVKQWFAARQSAIPGAWLSADWSAEPEHILAERNLHLTLMNQRFRMCWVLKELKNVGGCHSVAACKRESVRVNLTSSVNLQLPRKSYHRREALGLRIDVAVVIGAVQMSLSDRIRRSVFVGILVHSVATFVGCGGG